MGLIVNYVRRFDPESQLFSFVNVELYSNREILNALSFFSLVDMILCNLPTVEKLFFLTIKFMLWSM